LLPLKYVDLCAIIAQIKSCIPTGPLVSDGGRTQGPNKRERECEKDFGQATLFVSGEGRADAEQTGLPRGSNEHMGKCLFSERQPNLSRRSEARDDVATENSKVKKHRIICVIAALGSGQVERTHVPKIQTGGVQVDQRIDRIIRRLNGDIVLMPHARERLSFDRACLTREMFGGPRPVRQRCFPSGQGLVATAGFDSQLSFGSVCLEVTYWFVVVLHVITCRGDIKYRHTRHSIMSIRYTASVEGPKTPQVKLRIAEP